MEFENLQKITVKLKTINEILSVKLLNITVENFTIVMNLFTLFLIKTV